MLSISAFKNFETWSPIDHFKATLSGFTHKNIVATQNWENINGNQSLNQSRTISDLTFSNCELDKNKTILEPTLTCYKFVAVQDQAIQSFDSIYSDRRQMTTSFLLTVSKEDAPVLVLKGST